MVCVYACVGCGAGRRKIESAILKVPVASKGVVEQGQKFKAGRKDLLWRGTGKRQLKSHTN